MACDRYPRFTSLHCGTRNSGEGEAKWAKRMMRSRRVVKRGAEITVQTFANWQQPQCQQLQGDKSHKPCFSPSLELFPTPTHQLVVGGLVRGFYLIRYQSFFLRHPPPSWTGYVYSVYGGMGNSLCIIIILIHIYRIAELITPFRGLGKVYCSIRRSCSGNNIESEIRRKSRKQGLLIVCLCEYFYGQNMGDFHQNVHRMGPI